MIHQVLNRLTLQPSETTFKIADVHFGILITGAAMNNLQRRTNAKSYHNHCGIIAHELKAELATRFNFRIDLQKKKLAIIVHFLPVRDDSLHIQTDVKFEWNFRE